MPSTKPLFPALQAVVMFISRPRVSVAVPAR